MVAFRWNLIVALGLAATALAGCQNSDEIRRYQVPRAEAPKEKVPPRLLAAIVPHEKQVWFFKLFGPDPVVGEHKEEFDGFLRSVRFTGKADVPLAWTVPPGWREVPRDAKPGNMRYATFQLGSRDDPLELSVLPLPRTDEADSVLANVNRWRVQFLGLPRVTEAELDKLTTRLKLGEAVATVVDMTGPGAGRDDLGPLAAPVAPPAPAVEGGAAPKYTVPKGWKTDALKAFSVATFRTGEDKSAAYVTVSQVGGGLVGNVTRWRDQLGLAPVKSEEELRKDVREIKVAGGKAPYIELTGRAPDGRPQAILGVLVDHAGTPWIFKMSGPPEVVAGQKAAFEAFMQSVEFEGGKGAEQ